MLDAPLFLSTLPKNKAIKPRSTPRKWRMCLGIFLIPPDSVGWTSVSYWLQDQKPSFTQAYLDLLGPCSADMWELHLFWDIVKMPPFFHLRPWHPHTACGLLMSFCPICYTQTRETCALQNWNSQVDLSNSPADVAEDTTFSNSCCKHQICSLLKQVVKSPSKRSRCGKNGLCFTVTKRALQVVNMLVRDIRRFHKNLFLGNLVGWY